MLTIHLVLFLLIIVPTSAGPMEDLATMPDLSLFYQQLVRQQDIQMLLQGAYAQPATGAMSEFTIFAPNNEAMERFIRKNEDPSLLWRYHLVSGRYDEQMIFNMAQEKFSQVNPRQISGIRPQNNLPTVALPFQLFYGIGFYGGNGPEVNETVDNSGYGSGGISWLTHTSFNQTNLFDNSAQLNPYLNNRVQFNPNHRMNRRQIPMNNPNLYPQQQNYSAMNSQYQPTSKQFPNMNFNPNFQPQQSYGQMGVNGGVGVLRPTINNAFILQSRGMSRGIINVIDDILWPPERRDASQYKTAFDALEDGQFSRIRQLAERSDYFRSELRSMQHQTWFLPTDQAFSSMGSSLSSLLDQSSMNNTNDINEFIRAHVLPIVLYPTAMDSTKQVVTLTGDKWVTFRKVTQPDQTFQIDVVAGRQVGRILVSRPEDVRLFGNGIVYPISTILSVPAKSAADELTRTYQYFMNLVQQSGDLELLNLLQGSNNMNMFNPQNSLNITVLIPQQLSIQQLGNSQDLSMNLRRHILRLPVYVDQLLGSSSVQFTPYLQQNNYQFNQQQPGQQLPVQQQPGQFPTQQQPGQFPTQQQPGQFPTQQQPGQFPTQQQPTFGQPGFNSQQNQYAMPNFQRNTGSVNQQKVPTRQRRQINSQANNNFQNSLYQQQQRPISSQQQPQFPSQQQQQQQPQQQPYLTQQQQYLQQNKQFLPVDQQQQQQKQQFPTPQQPQQQYPPQNKQFMQVDQQQMMMPNVQQPLVPNQQQPMMPNQQPPMVPNQQQPMMPNQQQPMVPNQQQPMMPNQQQPMMPNQQGMFPNPTQQQPMQNTFPMSSYPQQVLFQDGQIYPTMDPQFSIQAQTSTGPGGNVVTLIGRPVNGPPFTATIVNGESNIPIRNGVMHVVRGLLSGSILPIDGVLNSIQGASAFGQLLQQTGVLDEVRQSGRPHTLFIPSNSALQSMGVTSNVDQLRQFVLRHICPDVLLDPVNNILRRSAGFYNQKRQKRQSWGQMRRNETNFYLQQGIQPATNLGQGYFQNQQQQQVPGGYPAAPTPFGSNNQLYNSWNQSTMSRTPINRQSSWNNFGGLTPNGGPQSCRSMTGERISVQSLGGTQSASINPSMSFQNFMVTCCGDQSVNALVQSYNVYPPNFAIYLLGRTLLPQGQTVNNLKNSSRLICSNNFLLFVFVLFTIFKQNK